MPDWKPAVRRRLETLAIDPTRRNDLVEEIAVDLDDRFTALLSAGETPADAERALEAELDELPLDHLLAAMHAPPDPPALDAPASGPVAGVWHDLRYAVRTLRRAPIVSAIAIATLTLGIGASTAMFSVVNAVLIAPLPFPEPERVLQVFPTFPDRGWARSSFSHANFWDLRDLNRSFADVGAITGGSMNLTGPGGPERLDGASVSAGFFRALGVAPVAGRLFADGEDRAGGNTRVVLLAHRAWTTRFGRDPGVVGSTVTLDGDPYTVIGVLPPGAPWLDEAEIFRPLVQQPDAQRGSFELSALGRLKPGVTREQAEQDLARVAQTLRERFPEVNRGFHLGTAPSSEWRAGDSTRRALWILMGAVACLLLIAAANLVNLLLAHAAGRAREVAVRAALGASRFRLVRQMAVESLVLGAAGGACGLLAAHWLVGVVRQIEAGVPRLAEVAVDGRVLLFTLAVSVGTSLVTGLASALHASHGALAPSLREGERGATGSRRVHRLRQALVGVEVALAMTLLVGAGLLVRSFDTLMRVDRGFETDGRMLVQISPPAAYDAVRTWQLIDGIRQRASDMPGVISLAAVSGRPLVPGSTGLGIGRPGAPDAGGSVPWATWRLVTPEYFQTLGVPLLRGRTFANHEEMPPFGRGTPLPAVVSQRVADLLYPGEDPIGRGIVLWKGQGDAPGEIVGVAGNIRERGLAEGPTLAVYLPYRGAGWRPVQLVVHAATEPAALVPALRSALSAIDPNVPISNVSTLDEVLAASVAMRRFPLLLFGGFAGLALLLALGGIHSVLAYSVARRIPEIGVRLALGATPGSVVAMIVTQGMRPVVAGLVAGGAAALALSRLMSSLLFEVAPTDAVTYVTVAILILLAGIAACLSPAMRALKLDVTAALRTE